MWNTSTNAHTFSPSQSLPASIPASQWELPVGLKQNNEFATLAELADGQQHLRLLDVLSPHDQRRVTVARLEKQFDYPTVIILGEGEVDRAKAIRLVKQDSAAGRQIVDCEQRVIRRMQQRLQNEPVHTRALWYA